MSSSTILPSFFHFLTSSDATWSFASIAFMATFLVFFLGYLLLEPSRRRRRLLAYTTAFSLFFAFKANGLLMLLLPTTTLLSWWITRRMAAETTTQRRRGLLVTNILITLLPLLYFKYSGSFVSSISAMMGENLPVGKLFMPLGISFYTFQAISYAVDVYRRRFPATTPLLEYTFYLTFFPLLMAGPITRAEVLIPQEHADPLPPRGPLAYQGLWLILLGIVKKVIIADYIAQYNNWIFDTPTDYTGFECLMGVIGFSVQIFCDFSGYSDLAIGLAALMGFRLQDNFRFPYQATSLTEFWHRWHISLSTWFRDYVYIPRAEVLIPQEHADPLPPRGPLAYQGLWLILLGIVKKVIIADYIAQYNNWIFDTPTDYTGFECLMGVIGFSVQIFCDFSGYSDLAIGLAALMGFRLQDNFRFPYQATSLTEFWHRWHISLSTWFRDYVYIPLGGNRRGELRTYLNHLATMLIAGVWHGATGMFVVWGLLHGVGLVVNKFFHRHVFVQIPPSPFAKPLAWLTTFGYVAFAWIFFRAPSPTTALQLLHQISSDCSLTEFLPFLAARPLWTVLTLVALELHSVRERDYLWLRDRFVALPWLLKLLVALVVVQAAINLSGASVQPFIYSRF